MIEVSYGLLMAFYTRDKLNFVKEAIQSIDFVFFDRVLFVIDGPVYEELLSYLNSICASNSNIRLLRLKENGGLGLALRIGVESLETTYIFRMDSDDLCMSNRFVEQKLFLEAAGFSIDLLGCQMYELDDYKFGLNRDIRRVPLSLKSIKRFNVYRNPFNHPTVVFKRQAILEVGNYVNMPYFEDWDLWDRLLLCGYSCVNMSDKLLAYRTGLDQSKRRSGFSYFIKERHFYLIRLRRGSIKIWQYYFRIFFVFIVRLLPIFVLRKLSKVMK